RGRPRGALALPGRPGERLFGDPDRAVRELGPGGGGGPHAWFGQEAAKRGLVGRLEEEQRLALRQKDLVPAQARLLEIERRPGVGRRGGGIAAPSARWDGAHDPVAGAQLAGVEVDEPLRKLGDDAELADAGEPDRLSLASLEDQRRAICDALLRRPAD